MKSALLLALAIVCTSWHGSLSQPVKPGVDHLIQDLLPAGYDLLKGKRIGLITNPTGISLSGKSTVELLHNSPELQLVALFGPEHGVYGDEYAGEKVKSGKDPRTGLPVHSLYGSTKKPTQEMLNGIDVLLYDIQDIGVRSYTYISTLGLAMEAAGEKGIPFVVLDRPNPLGGLRIEGPPTVEPGFVSFISQWPLPYVYGLTAGEVAKMIAGEKWIQHIPPLHIIPAHGWKRTMAWEDTGLPWVPTSPHIPTPEAARMYAITGLIGELGTISNGVGYTQPFSLIAHPSLKRDLLAENLNRQALPGIWFRPLTYKPFYAAHSAKIIHGIQIHLRDIHHAPLSPTGIHILAELRNQLGTAFLTDGKKDGIDLFNKGAGSSSLREQIIAGKTPKEIIDSWNEKLDSYQKQRQPHLLY